MQSGLILTADPVAPLLEPWRSASVPAASAGGPAHVTALYPWVAAPVTEDALRMLAETMSSEEPFSLVLDRLERFPKGVLYLALDAPSEQRVRRLSARVVDAFPGCIPYEGEHQDPVPHLTVAFGDANALDRVEAEIWAANRLHLPLVVQVAAVTVMEMTEGGTWVRAHEVPLGTASAPTLAEGG